MLRRFSLILLSLFIMFMAGCNQADDIVLERPSQNTTKPFAEEAMDNTSGIDIEIPMVLGTEHGINPSEEYLKDWTELINEKFGLKINVGMTYDVNKYFDGYYMKSVLEYDSVSGLVYFPSSAVNMLYEMIAAGEILPLTKALENNDVWNYLSDDIKKMYEIDGDVWAIPSELTYSVYTRQIRKTWLESLDTTVPSTIDELYDMCRMFTFEDPDGDGKNNTRGAWVIPQSVIDIFSVYDCRLQLVNNGAQITSLAYNPELKRFEDCMQSEKIHEPLELLRSMFAEGMVHNEGGSYGTMACFQEPYEQRITNRANMRTTDVKNLVSDYDFIFSLNGRATNPVYINLNGGFYVADNHMADSEDAVSRFVSVFLGDKNAYNIGLLGMKQDDVNYTNNDLTANGLPSVFGRMPGLYDERYDEFRGETLSGIEEERKKFAAAVKETVESDMNYMLYPRTGFGTYERTSYSMMSGYGTDLVVRGDALLGLFEPIYLSILHSNVSIEEGLAKYNEKAKKAGYDEYINDLNEKINR